MILLYIFFLIASIQSLLFTNGFIAGTKVKTETGYSYIEDIQINDEIICHNFSTIHLGKNKHPLAYCYSISKVTNIFKFKVNKYAKITINNETICTTINQKFYLPLLKSWTSAKNELFTNKKIINQLCLSYSQNLLSVDNIEIINEEIEVYDITVDKYHNYCIYPFDITVHNIAPVLVIAFTYAEIPIFLEFAYVSIGMIAAGTAMGLAYVKNQNFVNYGTTHLYVNPDAASPYNLSFGVNQLQEVQSCDSYKNPESQSYLKIIDKAQSSFDSNAYIINQIACKFNIDIHELHNLSPEELLKKASNISAEEINILCSKKDKRAGEIYKEEFQKLIKEAQEKRNSQDPKKPEEPKDNKNLDNAIKCSAANAIAKKTNRKTSNLYYQ